MVETSLSKHPPSATSKQGKETAKSKPLTAAATPATASNNTSKTRLEKINESQNSVNHPHHTDESNMDENGGVNGGDASVAVKEKPYDPYEDRFDDLTLRCVLYACLFQILIDRQEFEEALEQMDAALTDLPRTKHRLLIYRVKVITKSKLGLDVQMDLQKVSLFLCTFQVYFCFLFCEFLLFFIL